MRSLEGKYSPRAKLRPNWYQYCMKGAARRTMSLNALRMHISCFNYILSFSFKYKLKYTVYAMLPASVHKNTGNSISKMLKFPSVVHAFNENIVFILVCLPLNIYQTYKSSIKIVIFHFLYSSRHTSSWR